MWSTNWKLAIGVLLAFLAVPAWGALPPEQSAQAQPGTLNYVEGDVAIGSNAITENSIGKAKLDAGQTLTTRTGKAEILLTPGVSLRVGDHSSVTMSSPSLSDTEVGLNQGQATVEVTDIYPQNNIQITEDGANTQLMKTGLYDFDANQNQVPLDSVIILKRTT